MPERGGGDHDSSTTWPNQSSTLHKPPHPPQTHTRTHGLPHQDTVLHMNSGLNSILLGLRQQINRSSSATGNHILGQRAGLELKKANQPNSNTTQDSDITAK